MDKNFDNWNIKKKQVHNRTDGPFCHRREIWWCSLGINVGFEQDGSGDNYYRPVLILKVFSKQTFLAIPLTTSTTDHKLRPNIGLISGKEARALLSQIRVMDTKRLIHRIGYLDKTIFEEIRKTIKDLL